MEPAYERFHIKVLVIDTDVGIIGVSNFHIVVRVDAFVVHNPWVGNESYLVVVAKLENL